MLARLKKRTQEEVLVGPTAMEVTQSSLILQEPRESLLEVPEESIHREQPPGNPRTESFDTEVILQFLRDISNDTKQLRAEMDLLRAPVNKIHQWAGVAEYRLTSLEDRAWETKRTSSNMAASPCDPRAAPAASSSSFSSHQMILDDAQTTVSPSSASVYTAGASTEPDALSEELRTASSTLVLVDTEENVGFQEGASESEVAHTQDKEPEQQDNTFSGASPLIAPEHETEPQPLRSTEETGLPMMVAVWSEKRTSECETAQTDPKESDLQKNTFSGASPQEYEAEPQPSTSTLSETPQLTAAAARQQETPVRATKWPRRCRTSNKSSNSALTHTATSAGPLGHLASSSRAKVRSRTKRRQTSFVWNYFTKHPTSKFFAICTICREEVKTGKIGGCGIVGTAYQRAHLERKHDISQEKSSNMAASPCDPRAAPAASSSFFSSHQMILDAAQTTVSPSSASVYTAGASTEPDALSEELRTASSTLVLVDTEENVGFQGRASENQVAHTQDKEPEQQDNTFSGASPLIAPEHETEPQPLRSTEETGLPMIVAVWSEKRTSECETAQTDPKESDLQKNTFSGASPQEYEEEPQPSTSTLSETPQLTAAAAMQQETPVRATKWPRRCRTSNKSSNSTLTHAATSAGPLGHLASSSRAKVRSRTKRRQTSFVWKYFKKHPTSKFFATCIFCGEEVKTGKIGGCGKLGTSYQLAHLKRKHDISREKVTPPELPAAVSNICDLERPRTIAGPSRNVSAASTCATRCTVTLYRLGSSPPTEERSPTEH